MSWLNEERFLIKPGESEALFFEVLNDLGVYLDDLTLVGGWLPFVYSNYLWNTIPASSIFTTDIDFGFKDLPKTSIPKTVFEILSSLDYSEHHLEVGKPYPVVLYKKGKFPVEFITHPKISRSVVEKLLGRQIHVNKIEKFDFLLNHRILIKIYERPQKTVYNLFCPTPSAFLYHKGATFLDRENEQKQAKDLYYMYFILRYATHPEKILQEITQFHRQGIFKDTKAVLNRYFEKKSSPGCLLIEKENGPDEYIRDLRQDIFSRFKSLLSYLI
jgi:hypothetical protein